VGEAVRETPTTRALFQRLRHSWSMCACVHLEFTMVDCSRTPRTVVR
jgi:hypothetical protein